MKNPRIQVSLDSELYETIARLGRLTGQSSSRVVRSILEPQGEVLKQIADTVEEARKLAGPLSLKMNLRLTEGDRIVTGYQDQARLALDQLQLDLREERDRQDEDAREKQGKGL